MTTDTLAPSRSREETRVAFPVWVSFAGDRFLIKEFTADLSVGGIFLPTDREIAPLTRGELTFRASPWDEPFTVQAEVVRVVPAGGEATQGLGIQFIDLGNRERVKLERLVLGIRDGSVIQSIRRVIREEGRSLAEELRRRPTDQKVILAIGARGEEINALIRDGNSVVVERLLDNPTLSVRNVRMILQDPRTQTTFMTALMKHRRWTADEEVRTLFCKHPSTPIEHAIGLLSTLTFNRLRTFERDTTVRPRVRQAATDLLKRRGQKQA